MRYDLTNYDSSLNWYTEAVCERTSKPRVNERLPDPLAPSRSPSAPQSTYFEPLPTHSLGRLDSSCYPPEQHPCVAQALSQSYSHKRWYKHLLLMVEPLLKSGNQLVVARFELVVMSAVLVA